MHVFADLRPYICTFSDCKDELAQFTTRAAWADHEFTEHRNDQTWNCPECSAKLADASGWEQHLFEIHRRVFTGPQLHIARNAALQTHPRPIETEECPLCRIVVGKQRRAFVKHIGRHMEEIALMALPRDTEEDSDGSSASTDQNYQSLGNHEVLADKTGSETSEKTSPNADDGNPSSYFPPEPSLMLVSEDFTLHHDESEERPFAYLNENTQFEFAKDLNELTHSRTSRFAQDGTASVPSISLRPQNSAHAPGDEVEDYIIKCICGFPGDDGNTVYCDQCKTWQHTECYYSDKHGNVPTKEELEVIDHFCETCRPRSINAKGAIERLLARREDPERNSTTTTTVEEQNKARTSSYWSVAEKRDFYNYIRRFGTDWEAISTEMKTKTPIMVTISASNEVTESTDWVFRSRISIFSRSRKMSGVRS